MTPDWQVIALIFILSGAFGLLMACITTWFNDHHSSSGYDPYTQEDKDRG